MSRNWARQAKSLFSNPLRTGFPDGIGFDVKSFDIRCVGPGGEAWPGFEAWSHGPVRSGWTGRQWLAR
jgi:hypothetical protein